jgi:hypothetical protein
MNQEPTTKRLRVKVRGPLTPTQLAALYRTEELADILTDQVLRDALEEESDAIMGRSTKESTTCHANRTSSTFANSSNT